MDFNIFMYLTYGVLAIVGALGLLIAKHPLRGAMGLLVTMLALAGMYAQLHAHTIAVFQVIIYAGAIMVLIIYFIMLLDIQSQDYIKRFAPLFWLGAPVVAVIVGIFLYKLMQILGSSAGVMSRLSNAPALQSSESYGGMKAFSTSLLTTYTFAFEYVSTLLFAAIVAVIAIVQLDWKGQGHA
ncbi:NADH-quinone oxidoreductase subunit J [candidate division KSB1 bacterium]|nr:NADH-quinone oxidoreductase subunit J [candidate division KSB1 bacterium]